MFDFLKTHWRPLAVVLALLIAFGAGRFEAPTKTVTTSTAVDHTVETQLAQARTQINTLTAENTELKRHTHEVKTIVVQKDGTRQTTDITDTDVDRTEQAQTAQQTVATQQLATRVEQTHQETTTKTVTSDAPRLTLGAGVGVPVAPKAPFLGSPVVLAQGSYRFWGPLSAGAWVTAQPAGGPVVIGGLITLSF